MPAFTTNCLSFVFTLGKLMNTENGQWHGQLQRASCLSPVLFQCHNHHWIVIKWGEDEWVRWSDHNTTTTTTFTSGHLLSHHHHYHSSSSTNSFLPPTFLYSYFFLLYSTLQPIFFTLWYTRAFFKFYINLPKYHLFTMRNTENTCKL